MHAYGECVYEQYIVVVVVVVERVRGGGGRERKETRRNENENVRPAAAYETAPADNAPSVGLG